MEKRTDLAQLFCMIGRHGPAVAVAVMAMVSVVAGFIIYRSVKGKRRKAAAGDGACGSRGASASELEETRSCVAPTDLSDDDLLDMNVANVTRSPGNLRKRRAAEKTSDAPKKELEPENRLDASRSLDSSGVAEECAKVAWTVEEVCNLSLPDDEPSKDAEEVQSSCLTPVETSAGHENEEVPKAQEVGLAVNNALDEKLAEMEKLASNSPTCPENAPANQNQDDAQIENQTTPETIDVDSCLEEPVICMTAVISSSKDKTKEMPHPDQVKFSDGNNCSSSENVESVPQTKNAHEQQMALDHVIGYSTSEQPKVPSSQQGRCEDMIETMLGAHDILDANCSPFSEVIEKDIDEDHLKHLATISPVTLEHKNQELVSEHTVDPSCNQEDGIKGVTSSFEECDGSHGISVALPCLNRVELETMHDQGLCATEAELCGFVPVYLQQEVTSKYEISLKLPKDTGLDGLAFESGSLQMEKKETVTDLVVLDSSLDNLLTSFIDADVCSVMPSFQNQECEQVQIEDFSEVPTLPVPDLSESITMCQGQLPSFEHGELTWSSCGVGEESGISSMTVSPDLPDMECDATPERMAFSVTGQYPVSEEHVEDQWNFLAEEVEFVSKDILAGVSLESCPSHELAHIEHTKANALPPTNEDASAQEIEENFKLANHLIAQVVASEVCLMDALQNEMDTKADVESEQKEMSEKDKMTEINIMEATMDTNEWITDGNHEVPWINLSVSAPHNTRTASVSSGHHLNSVPVDSPSKNADPLFKHSSITNEGKGSDKKVVAVQPMPQNVKVTFRIHYLTNSPYQKVAVTGNKQELGNWKGFIPLEKAKDGHWSAVVNLPAESHMEWKFVVVNQGEVCRWEECGNRVLDTGSAEDLLVHKWWGFF
ncbi:uncharacterized protein stbd1 [Nematolebias whitei]|uniref:uncharacterized protein stbd1 n=1 Tax=Nematolebias whitei TaxID=451745 RepID=UPI00189C438D|nr:uncharacterized protein stbd1 [Nematolebias whitei]